MPKTLRILVALLACAALTTSPALAAEPATAEATFVKALVNLPPLPVEGELDFEQAEGAIKVKGEFRDGFAQDNPAEYELVVVDDAGKVVVDLTKEWADVAEVESPAVAEFEFTTKTKQEIADLLKQDVVVYQIVNVAGLKLLAEIGRAEVAKG